MADKLKEFKQHLETELENAEKYAGQGDEFADGEVAAFQTALDLFNKYFGE